MLEENTISPTIVDKRTGVVRFDDYAGLANEMGNMSLSNRDSHSHFAGAFSHVLETSIMSTEQLGAKQQAATLTTGHTPILNNGWDLQLTSIAKLIKLDTQDLKTERAAFVASEGGFDTHGSTNLAPQLDPLNTALTNFVAELKAQGVWENTTIVAVSDFGRTLTSNNRGTDHAWGGHYFVLGGGVRGSQILGKYPDRLDEQFSDVDIGRGRMMPTTSWEALWNGVARWWGVPDAEMANVLPNAANFPSSALFSTQQLFKDSSQ